MVIITVLLMFSAIVIEGGNLLLQRRNLQGNADSAALAGAAYLPAESAEATNTARTFVTDNNASDQAKVDGITLANSDTELKVDVRRKVHGSLMGLLGVAPPTIRATATAAVAKMSPSASEGMLPMAFMRDSYTLGDNAEVKFDGTNSGNRGAIAPDNNPPHCVNTSGASDFSDIIRSEAQGGIDACAYAPGDTLPSEPGNMSGPTRQGFDDRIGGNTQSFEEVFDYDATTGRWSVIDSTSPRIGLVPIVENMDGSNTWDGGRVDLRVIGYVMVYIGKTDDPPTYPAYTDGGKSVWVTPVAAILPDEWSQIGEWYDGNGDEPIVLHLTK